MPDNEPWFRYWFGHSIWPINRKGWATAAANAGVSVTLFSLLRSVEWGSPAWRLYVIGLVGSNLVFWAFIRNKIEPN